MPGRSSFEVIANFLLNHYPAQVGGHRFEWHAPFVQAVELASLVCPLAVRSTTVKPRPTAPVRLDRTTAKAAFSNLFPHINVRLTKGVTKRERPRIGTWAAVPELNVG
jgi:hypothetical protein